MTVTRHTLCLAAALVSASPLALAAGWVFSGPGTPIPRPPNPTNNPWLNYPLFYGPGADSAGQHARHGENAPDAVSNLDRYFRLPAAERHQYAQNAAAASLKRGEALFASSRLGTTGLDCHACHLNGGTVGGKVNVGEHEVPIPSLRGVAQRFPAFKPGNDRVITQTEMQNNCIVLFLKGPPLATGTQEAADLTHFVASLKEKPLP